MGIALMRIKPSILAAFLALLVVVLARLAVVAPRERRVTLSFDYDFRLTPACSLTLTKNCVKQFNVYDMSAERRMRLFSIPVPVGAAGLVKGITGTSPPLPLTAGKHIFAVTAESADGGESDSNACSTTVQIKP
jgi:hypothetical protein